MPELQQRDIGGGGRLSGMRGPGGSVRRGRRGRRTAAMIRAAQERIRDLFSLAETEVWRTPRNLSQRYVSLARRIGMRYNVRLLREYRDLYCRGCSSFWVEGRTLRTRFRRGRRVQTCLACGRVRRVPVHARRPRRAGLEATADEPVRREETAFVEEEAEASGDEDLEEEG